MTTRDTIAALLLAATLTGVSGAAAAHEYDDRGGYGWQDDGDQDRYDRDGRHDRSRYDDRGGRGGYYAQSGNGYYGNAGNGYYTNVDNGYYATNGGGYYAQPQYGGYQRGRGSYDPRYANGGYGGYQQRNVGYGYGRDRRYQCNSGSTGTILGAIVGGLIGNGVAGRGDRTLGTVIGGGAGAIAGNAIDKGNRRC